MTHSEFIKTLENIAVEQLAHSKKIDIDNASIDFYFATVYEMKMFKLRYKRLMEIVFNLQENNFEKYVSYLDTHIVRLLASLHNPSSSLFSEATYKLSREVDIWIYNTVCMVLNRTSILRQ